MICSGCSPTECRDRPKAGESIEVACPSCDENGCRHCDDRGYFKIDGCPQEFVGGQMIDFVKYADFAKRGTMPNDGGLLKQPNWFIDATNFMIAEAQRVKNEQMKT